MPRSADDVPPIVVGGTGGSGTRVVRAVLAQAGAFMGSRLNGAGDAMDFEPFLDAVINQVLGATRSLDYPLDNLPGALRRRCLRAFDAALACYRVELPHGQRWGWKNPRSMYVLPLIHCRFPGMTFVHVVRDGLDMTLSLNRNQLRKHHAPLFGRTASETDHWAALRMWSITNRQVAEWGERMLGSRYVRVRFEDLCYDPSDTCAALVRGVGLPHDTAAALGSIVIPPPTIGRGHGPPVAALGTEPSARRALAAFGYG